MARRRRSRNGLKLFIAALAVILAAAALILFLPIGGSGTLKSGTMEARIEQRAVVIRDENCIPVEQFDQVDYLVNEGAGVNAETPVATVYKWGYTDEMTQSLITIQQRIYEKQMSILDGIETAELASINGQIAQLRQRIQACVAEDGGEDLLALEREMKALLSQRTQYLKTSVQPDMDLNSLYDEETAKLNQIAEYTSTVSAKMTGRVSFSFDGYEQVLSANKMDVVNTELISKVLSGAGESASNESMLYRLVNPTRWYIAFITPAAEGLRLMEGQTYMVEFDGLYGQPYTGKALAPAAYDGGVLNLLEFSEDIGQLLSARVINATITASMTGFEADLEAIKVKNGKCVIDLGSAEREVSVVAVEEDTALIVGDGLSNGMRYQK